MAVLAISLACSDRERTNPLDPGNSDRNRGNLGFNALAGNNQVLLEWNRLDFDDLAGVRVQRIESGTDDTVTVTDSSLSLSTTRYVDNTSKNGNTYSYHLAFDVEGSDEKPVTMSDTVTPGPVFTYVELIDYGEVVLFTPDFRDEVFSLDAGFFDVVDIEVGSTVWVLDANGAIHRFNRNGELIGSGDLLNASAMTFNLLDSSSWVALTGETGLVYHFHSNGDLINSKATNLEVTSIALEREGLGDLWIGSSEPSIAKLSRSSNSSTQYSHSDFVNPELVVTSRHISGVWIGDHGANRVMHFTSAGMRWSTDGFTEVNDLVINDDGSLCWVADAPADKVYILNGRSGEVISSMSGFGSPFYLAYNRANHTVLVSGSTGLLSTISESGELLSSVLNPDRTGKISLAY
jgi:hypothetical protein